GQAELRGASRDSSELVFRPGQVQAGNYRFDIGTAGATSLVLHTLYLPLALRGGAASQLTITGGTHVLASPCFHFLETTWRRYMTMAGLRCDVKMPRAGFYPRGGGILEATGHRAASLKGLKLAERGRVSIRGFSAVAGLPPDISARQARRATNRLRDRGFKPDIKEESWPGGPGTVLAIEVG